MALQKMVVIQTLKNWSMNWKAWAAASHLFISRSIVMRAGTLLAWSFMSPQLPVLPKR